VDAALGAELAAIEHGSTGTIALGFDAADVAHPLDGTGYVVPRTEPRPVLACTWVSSKHRGRAPEGAVQFRVFVGGGYRPDVVEWSDEQLVALARAELKATLGVTAAPRLVHIVRWVGAMPQYLLGHPERVARIEAREAALPWLALAGNAYRGVGVPDCIASGERAAARVLDTLAAAPTSGDAALAAAP
jgi:oxygen-dependent protoporphyrinogen oxidase